MIFPAGTTEEYISPKVAIVQNEFDTSAVGPLIDL